MQNISALLVAALLMSGCGDSLSPVARPPAPRMVHFQDDPFLERGIRPDPNAALPEDSRSGAIIVEWMSIDTATLDGVRLGGFKLYRSESRPDPLGAASSFELIATLPATVANVDTFYSDSSARQNVAYAYYVTAYSADDRRIESSSSDTVSFTLSERPVPLSPTGRVAPSAHGSLHFRFSPATASGYVAVALDEISADNEQLVLRQMWRERGMAGFYDPSLEYTGDSLRPGHRYRWRVEKIFPQGQPIGNASRWVTFLVQ